MDPSSQYVFNRREKIILKSPQMVSTLKAQLADRLSWISEDLAFAGIFLWAAALFISMQCVLNGGHSYGNWRGSYRTNIQKGSQWLIEKHHQVLLVFAALDTPGYWPGGFFGRIHENKPTLHSGFSLRAISQFWRFFNGSSSNSAYFFASFFRARFAIAMFFFWKWNK